MKTYWLCLVAGILLFIFSLTPVYAIVINVLNDSSTSKNITFTGSENQTVYIEMPKKSYTGSAYLNLSGISLGTNTSDYIDDDTEDAYANFTSSAWSGDPDDTVDEDINTFAVCDSDLPYEEQDTCTIWENTTLAYTSSKNYTWNSKLFWSGDAGCDADRWHETDIYCYNSTDWYLLYNRSSSSTLVTAEIELPLLCVNSNNLQIKTDMHAAYDGDGTSCVSRYYEGFLRAYQYLFPSNTSLNVGDDATEEWTYSNYFFHSNNKTSDFSSSINTFLSSCNQDANENCQVPMILHSDSSGIININDIYVSYIPNETQNFGCTNSTTFAFSKNVPVTGTKHNLNFTSLVLNGYVKSDLSDVLVTTSGVTANKNITGSLYYIVVNYTSVNDIDVEFGNYYVNNSYGNNVLSDNTTSMSSYVENNPYYYLFEYFDELSGSSELPQSTNVSVNLYCNNGETTFAVDDTKFIIATIQRLDEAKTSVQYTSSSFYYRNLLIDSDNEIEKYYLLDATENTVVQIIVTLEDLTGNFDDADLRITKTMGNSNEVITELNFDAENKAIIYLNEGDKYTIIVTNGNETRSIGYLYADSSDLTKTVTLGDVSYTNTNAGNISTNITYSANTITFNWNDNAGNTSLVEFWVYNYTSGEELYSASSSNATSVSFNYITSAENDTYEVVYQVTHDDLGTWKNTEVVFGSGTYAKPTSFPITDLTSRMGGDTSLWLSLLFILPLPMLFSKRHSAIGALIMVLLAVVFAYWEIFPVDTVIVIPVVGVIVVLGLIRNSRKEDDTL